jgi:predicted GNAT family acetyltransferase
MTPQVADVPDRSRYELTVDGELAGIAEYVMREGVRVFTHTEVFDAGRGEGLGSALAQGALDDVRARGMKLVPRCPFIAAYIERHDEYADLVDGELAERLAARRR